MKYAIRVPRFAAGIRAQESRTGAGRGWWARRWLESIEAMNPGARLGRGRNYAVSGQVTDLVLEGPRVTAKVLGVREDPYSVSVTFSVPAAAARKKIVAALRRDPMTVARLLADDLPMAAEEAFRRAGAPLFPGGKIATGRYDVTFSCSCPDYANPCKHTIAVLLLLGEEIARRPMTLLECRGVAAEELYEG